MKRNEKRNQKRERLPMRREFSATISMSIGGIRNKDTTISTTRITPDLRNFVFVTQIGIHIHWRCQSHGRRKDRNLWCPKSKYIQIHVNQCQGMVC
jgi:hypothetical protein